MSEKYWGKKYCEVGKCFGIFGNDIFEIEPKKLTELSAILRQIASDQREACAKAIENIIDPDKLYHEIFSRYILSAIRNAEIGLESKQNGEVKS